MPAAQARRLCCWAQARVRGAGLAGGGVVLGGLGTQLLGGGPPCAPGAAELVRA